MMYGIIRAAYHGGDLNGGEIIILMDKAHEIMVEIKGHLTKCEKKIQGVHTQNKMS